MSSETHRKQVPVWRRISHELSRALHELSRALWTLVLALWLCLKHACLTLLPPRSGDSVRGRTWLVTGAAGGLGRELAGRLAARGAARLVLWDVDCAALCALRDQLNDLTAGACAVHVRAVDVGCAAQVRDAARDALAQGPVHVLVNNAAVAHVAPLLQLTDEQIEHTYKVNVLAHYWTARAFLPAMQSSTGGHIVTVGSVAGMIGAHLCTAYSGSKAAAHGAHESLYQELRMSGAPGRVTTTLLCPWYMRGTGMFRGAVPRAGRALRPADVAARLLLAVDRREPLVVMPAALAYALPLKTVLPVRLGWELTRRVARAPQTMQRMYEKCNNNNQHKMGADPPAA